MNRNKFEETDEYKLLTKCGYAAPARYGLMVFEKIIGGWYYWIYSAGVPREEYDYSSVKVVEEDLDSYHRGVGEPEVLHNRIPLQQAIDVVERRIITRNPELGVFQRLTARNVYITRNSTDWNCKAKIHGKTGSHNLYSYHNFRHRVLTIPFTDYDHKWVAENSLGEIHAPYLNVLEFVIADMKRNEEKPLTAVS